MAVIDELLVALGFDYDPDDLEQFNKDLNKSISLIKKLATAVIAGTTALIAFSTATTAVADKQGKLAKQTGLSVGEIDSLQFALKRAGENGDSLEATLEQFSIRLSEASRGTGSAVEALGILGLTATDSNGKLKGMTQVILEVSDAIQGLDTARQIDLADKLGLKDAVLLLQEGSAGIKALTAEARAFGVTTDKDAAISADFQDSLVDIFQIVRQISRVLSSLLTPALDKIANNFTEWFKINRELLEQNIPKFIKGAANALKLLTIASLAFIGIRLLSTIGSLVILFRSLTIAALTANAAIASIPILIGAAIVALGLLIQDFFIFLQGGDSLIGDFIKKWPILGKVINAVVDTVKALVAPLGKIGESINSFLFDLSSGKITDAIKDDLTSLVNSIKDDLTSLVNSIKDDFASLVNSIKDDFASLGNIILGVFKSIDDDITLIVESMSNAISKDIEKLTKFIDRISGKISDFFGLSDEEITLNESSKSNINTSFDPVIIGDVPTINTDAIQLMSTIIPEINTDSIQLMSGFSTDTSVQSEQTIPKDVVSNSSNRSASLSIGDIKVDVSGNQGNVKDTAKAIGEGIRLELGPILRQASLDLNSAVEI